VGAAAVRLRLLFAHPLKTKGLCVGIGDVTAQEFAQGIEVHFASQLSIIPLHLCEARRSNGIERIEIDLAAFERLNCYFFEIHVCVAHGAHKHSSPFSIFPPFAEHPISLLPTENAFFQFEA